MMKNAQPIEENLQQSFASEYSKSTTLRAATNALYKNKLDDVASVMPRHTSGNFHFSIEVPTLPVANQKQSGRCWIFAGLNLLREQVAHKCSLKEFELSQNYTAFWDKLEKCNWYLESIIDLAGEEVDNRTLCWVLESGIADGGQWDMLVALIEKYGVVPKDAMPETANSGATAGVNKLLMQRLVRAAATLRQQYQKNASSADIQSTKQSAMQDIYNILCGVFGTPPTKFDFEYTDKEDSYHIDRALSPVAFYQKYTAANLTDYVSVINAPTSDKPYYHTYTVDYLGNVVGGQPIQYLNLPMDELESLVIQSLQAGEPVWFGSDVARYGDRAAGLWDDALFDYESLFDINIDVSKTDALDLRLSAMNHAMLITGVSLDETSRPTKWKIENSWGDESGKKGYYIMSESWFERYVYQAVVKKSSLNDKQQKALATESIHLHPWDPMGTLANF